MPDDDFLDGPHCCAACDDSPVGQPVDVLAELQRCRALIHDLSERLKVMTETADRASAALLETLAILKDALQHTAAARSSADAWRVIANQKRTK